MSEATENADTSRSRLLAVIEKQLEEREKLQKGFKIINWIPMIFATIAILNMFAGVVQSVESPTRNILIVMAFGMLAFVVGMVQWNNGLIIKNLEAWLDYLKDPAARDLGALDPAAGTRGNPFDESTG